MFLNDDTMKTLYIPVHLSDLTIDEQGILFSMLNENANNIPFEGFIQIFDDTTLDNLWRMLNSLIEKGYVKYNNGIYSLVADRNNTEFFRKIIISAEAYESKVKMAEELAEFF